MYISQIIMQYTLNLYSVVCQLYLSKTGRKKKTDTAYPNSLITALLRKEDGE